MLTIQVLFAALMSFASYTQVRPVAADTRVAVADPAPAPADTQVFDAARDDLAAAASVD